MSFFSILAGKVINATADGIVAVALHVPFLMHALMSIPYTPPAHPIVETAQHNVTTVHASPSVQSSKQPPIASSTENATIDNGIRSPFSFSDYFEGETSINKTPYIDPVTGSTVGFKLLTDTAHQSVNATFNVYVGGNEIGEVAGEGQRVIGFSPDGKYLAIRSRYNVGCAGMCQDFEMSVVDLQKMKVIWVPLPKAVQEYSGKGTSYDAGALFISSSTWSTSDVLNINYFVVGNDRNSGDLYRISPEVTWSYDPATGTGHSD